MPRDYKADRRKAEDAARNVEAAWKQARQLDAKRKVLYKKFKTVMAEMKGEIKVVMDWFRNKKDDEKLLEKYRTQDEWTKAVFGGMTAGNVRRYLRPPKEVPWCPRPPKASEPQPLPEIPEGDSKPDESPTNDEITLEIMEFINSKTRDLTSDSQRVVFRTISMKLGDYMKSLSPIGLTANHTETEVAA